jgi:hypothetical protein
MVSNPSIRNHTVVQMSRNSRGQYVMGHNGGPAGLVAHETDCPNSSWRTCKPTESSMGQP